MAADQRVDQLTAAVIGDLTDLSLLYAATTADAGVTFADKKVSLSLFQNRTFTTQLAQGTIVASTPSINQTVTWNNAAVRFVQDFRNITNTASLSTSAFVDWQVGGVSKFIVNNLGGVFSGWDPATADAAYSFALGGINTSSSVRSWVAAAAGTFNARRANGTMAAPTRVSAGDAIAQFTTGAWRSGGTPGFSNGGDLLNYATENWIGTGAGGNQWVFRVCANAGAGAGSGLLAALLLDQDQSVTIWGALKANSGTVVIGSGLQLSTLGAFASGDKYLIVDSSGNVHKSALGPAS